MRLIHTLTGDRGHSGNQRPPLHHSFEDGNSAADVLADHAHLRGQAAAGYLLAGEYFYQLFLAAGRVFGGKLHDLDSRALRRGAQGRQASGLLSSTPIRVSCRVDQVLQYSGALDNLLGAFAHQDVIGGDIGLTLGAVDDQCFNVGAGFTDSLTALGKPAPPMPAIPALRISSIRSALSSD